MKTPAPPRSRAILLAILIASFALSLAFALRVPLNGNPDETDHRDYIRLLIRDRGWVRFAPAPFDMPSTDTSLRPFETHQPPLYYLLCIPIQLASGGSVVAVRLVAALLQLLTIWVAFRAVRDLFPGEEALALGAAAFVAFLPSQAQLAAAISNDSLTTLICATIFWKLGRLVQRGKPARPPLLLGVLIGAGILTKLTVLQLLPAVLVACALAVHAKRLTLAAALRDAAATFGVALAIAAPWLIRNTRLYGDPLALRIYKLTGPNFTPEQIMAGLNWSFADYVRNAGIRSFATFWYLLGPNFSPRRVAGPPSLLLVVVAIALLGLLGAYRYFKEGGGESQARPVVGLYITAVLLLVPFFARFLLTVFQAQGRYFLPVLLPVAVVTVLGWSQWTLQKRTIGIIALIFVLIALSLYQLSSIVV